MTLIWGCSIAAGPAAEAIAAATSLSLAPPWVLPEGAATHAWPWWGHGDGLWYRLDAGLPHAQPSRWSGPWVAPGAHWQILLPGLQALDRILALAGTPYSLAECGIQPVLRWLPTPLRVAAREVVEAVTPGIQCTVLTCDVLMHAGFPCNVVVDRMIDRFPERLAWSLNLAARQPWCQRLPSTPTD